MIRAIMLLLSILIIAPVAFSQKKTPSFWERVWKFFGVSATSSSHKGIEDKGKNFENIAIFDGNIWLYNVQTRSSALLKEGDFRSPVFLSNEQAILAVTGERVVKIALADGSLTEVTSIPGIRKLVGVENDSPDNVLVLTDLDRDNCPAVGVLSLTTRSVTPVPHEGRQDDLALVTYLSSWNREYSDETSLEVKEKSEENGSRIWTDVWLKLKNKNPVNASRCDGIVCSQPAISADRSKVVFVRAR